MDNPPPQKLVRIFAERTRHNLDFVTKNKSKSGPYEVTQLINSLLGLLVFPREKFVDSLPDYTFNDLKQKGWPLPHVITYTTTYSGLRDLLRVLRNSIAHFNLELLGDQEIEGIRLWNINDKGNNTWSAEMSIKELEDLAYLFLDLLEREGHI